MTTTYISTSHARRKLRVMVAGVESFAGKLLWKFFNHRGFEVIPVRQRRSGLMESATIIDWEMIEEQGLPRCDFVVNCSHSDPFEELRQFNEYNKIKMEQGRYKSTKVLADVIKESDRKPLAFVNLGSAFYYPASIRAEPYTENFVLPETSALNLSYFTRLEKEIESLTQVYFPETDVLPKHHPMHLDHEEFYKSLEDTAARPHDIVQKSRDAEHHDDKIQISSSSNIAGGDANAAFAKVRSHDNLMAAGLHVSDAHDADENMRFQHSASSLEINSNPITNEQVRVITARVGHVIAPGSPLLTESSMLRKWGMLGPLGVGTQITPWIHEIDFCEMILQALVDEKYTSGPLNVVSPVETSNAEIMKSISLASHSPPSHVSIGNWLVVKKYGPVAAQLLLESVRVKPAKAIANNFQFKFPHIDAAAMNIFERVRKHTNNSW